MRGSKAAKEYKETDQIQAAAKTQNDALRTERLQKRNDRKRRHDGDIKRSSPEGGHTRTHPKITGESEGDPNETSTFMRDEISHTPDAYSTSTPQVVEEITINPNDEILQNAEAEPKLTDNHSSLEDMMAFKAVADPDVMYLHQAMKQQDKRQFIEAMKKEVQDQSGNGNFSLIRRSQVPQGRSVLPAVWQMKRKCDIRARQIKKYKARLNIDGSRMKAGIDYGETYAPVTSWRSIRLILSLVASNNWYTRQLDYVLAFPQAPVERELYMEIPKCYYY